MANKLIAKCVYAGDEKDEFCAECDGVTLIEADGSKLDASICGGYTIEEEVVPAVEQVEQAPPVSTLTDHAEPRESNENIPSGTISPTNNIVGVTVEIQAESGISLEIKNKSGGSTWYKLGYTEKVSVPEGADLEYEREKLWERVNGEVDKQVTEVYEINNIN